jgi:hypothetical protein
MQGSGNVITERRDVSGYRAVAFSGIGELTIDQNGSEGLTLEGEDNILPFIRTEVRDGVLLIGPEGLGTFNPTRPLRFNLSARNMDGVDVSGAGSARAASLEAPSLQLGVSGAGSLTVGTISSGDLRVHISGSGYMAASGRVSNQRVNISGSGEYRASDLSSSAARVSISGAGAAVLRVSETLDADISGAGSVRYIGNPTVSRHISGVGSIQKLSNS